MTIFSKMPRLSFTGKTPGAGQSMQAPFRGKALRRRRLMAKEAAEMLPHLPEEPGTATHFLMTGRADLMVVLVELLAHYGSLCQYLRLATLSFNGRNTVEMAALLHSDRVNALTLLCSSFFRHHNDREYSEAKSQAALFPGRWQIAAARSHAKIVCADFSTRKVVAEGSPNLRSNGCVEQLAVILDDDLHDWHAQWIDDQVSRHGQDEEDEAGAGQ